MEFISGFAVGIAQVVVGHPFDTAKVLIQNKFNFKNLRPKEFYRGWKYPLFSSTICNTFIFPIKESSYKYTNNYWISGGLCGLFQGPVLYTFDLYKIKKQTKLPVSYKNILTNYGKYSSILSETMALSCYFGSYHWARDQNINPAISGSIAGLVNWSITYPIDVVKSRQIALNIPVKKAIEMGNLYKGLNVCLTRAIIVNAINFTIYEKCMNYLKNKVN